MATGKILEFWGCLEAVNHPTLLLTSILDVYEVFEHLHMVWMGIQMHPYTDITVQGGAKILEKWDKVDPK